MASINPSLAERVKEIEEKENVDNLLKYPDAWNKIREDTIDKESNPTAMITTRTINASVATSANPFCKGDGRPSKSGFMRS